MIPTSIIIPASNPTTPATINPADETLFNEFDASYKEYKTFQSKETKVPNAFIVTLFGVPSAGKSTLTARLQSDDEPEVFMEKVINRKEDFVVSNGIRIGRSMMSTTVVPKRYVIENEVLLYDAPGFKDNDPNKDIIINILHKCLLTHVKKSKIVVILKMDCLEDRTLQILLTSYYDAFEKLFAKDFEKCLKNVYFIVTHFDKSLIDINDVPALLKTRTLESLDVPREHLSKFMFRMSKKHVVVDYRYQTRRDIIDLLKQMFDGEENSDIQTEDLVSNLSVKENELDRKLANDIRANMAQWEHDQKEIFAKLEEIYCKKMEKKTELANLTVSRDRNVQSLAVIREALKDVDAEIHLIDSYNKAATLKKSKLMSDNNLQDTLYKSLGDILYGQSTIVVRGDCSIAPLIGSHYFEGSIDIEKNYTAIAYLMVKYEKDNGTLKALLSDKKDSIVPNDLSDIRNKCVGNIILFNSLSDHLSPGVVFRSSMLDNNVLRITASCPCAFKVFIFTSHPMPGSQVDQKLSVTFCKKKIENEEEMKGCDLDVRAGLARIAKIRLEDVEQRSAAAKLVDLIAEENHKITQANESILEANAGITEYIEKVQKHLDSVSLHKFYIRATSIVTILMENKLRGQAEECLKILNDSILRESTKLKSFEAKVAQK